MLALATPGRAQIDVEIVAGDNIIVDSNVLSPSTYAPETFTVQVTYCNNTAAPINDVYAHIGNIDDGGATAATPGTYPVRDSDADAAFQAESPHLANTGDYFITHAAVQADTTRYIGTLNPGQCVTLYWMMCYPKLSNTGTEPVWGESRLDNDDLWLELDAWASQLDAGTINPGNSVGEDTHEVTMRRSIGAMANKVSGPTGAVWTVTDLNGNPLDAGTPAKPGQVIKVCGTGFNLGVDNKGYDSDGNFAPDYAVWLQPVGDKNLYDPLCFRLVRTEGQLRISRSGGNPTYVLDFVDQTYFTDLPNDTNGGVGDVCYHLVAMTGPCSMALSPYQMVASGADNEKFNGDFGAASPGVDTGESPVTFSKSVDLDSAAAGTALTYDILFTNPAGEDPLGLPEYGMPLVVNEQIPAGTSYVAGSAEGIVAGETTANYNDSGGFMDVLYSTDDGLSYTNTEPGDPTQVTHIQWWLDSKLQGGDSAFVQFQVAIDDPFSGSSPLIENTAGLSFGDGPPFREDQAGTLLTGNNSLGGTVWKDSDRDGTLNGGETGIQDVQVSLYFDVDGDGVIDEGDPLIATRDTAADGTYS
ncbi:MAG: hypothetical protein HKN82_10615, partial [Akkermansiaceae bacterium]|nr:hypothetical protein [Akkermansiaceae bacterium]